LQEYLENIRDAGFENILVDDETNKYVGYTKETLEKLHTSAPAFKKRFGEDSFDYSSMSWTFQKEAFQKKEIQVVRITANKKS
jgi:hypothetical protein